MYNEVLAGILHGPVIRLSDRLSRDDRVLISELIDANELGLALEQMADVLCEDEQPLSPEERSHMLGLADRMPMDDRVPKALAFCPNR